MLEKSPLGMKAARWVRILLMTLLLMAGTMHCAGPQPQVTKEPASATVSREKAEMSKEGSREAPAQAGQDRSPDASRGTAPDVSREAVAAVTPEQFLT